jgi:predicted nucleotidyltransferase
VYFSANRDAPIFPELRSIVEKTAGAVDVLRSALAPLLREDRIDVAIIFGSVATGRQTSASDVDLLLVGDVTLSEVVPLVRSAEARLGREVNPSVYGTKEFRAKVNRGSAFLKRIQTAPKLFVVGDEHELGRLAR